MSIVKSEIVTEKFSILMISYFKYNLIRINNLKIILLHDL